MRLWKVSVPVLMGLLLVNTSASTRDFRAHFRYTDSIVTGEEVQVRFVLRLWNTGSNNLTGATVKLQELRNTHMLRRVFNAVDVPAGENKILRGFVKISLAEFEGWEKGFPPRLSLEFSDHKGAMQQFPVDISRFMGDSDEN